MRYYHAHFLVALAISIVTLSPTAGAMFYVGREVRDYQKGGGNWDLPGLLWPVLGLLPLIVGEIYLKVLFIHLFGFLQHFIY